ncbi:hypothetical protein FRC06_008272 [Ceratobasidium sp. 370]|nr:hypothetical protein FRC06_008272 [Ceratobasidium sp. 370]
MLGRIQKIWVPQDRNAPTCISIRVFNWISDDSILVMPAVTLQDNLVVVNIQNVLGIINLQHRCAFAGCTDNGQVVIRQERQDTSATRKAIQHVDDINFVVNIHSMHNAKLVTELLHGRFRLRAQLGDPVANVEIRKRGAQQVRLMRQKENKPGNNAVAEVTVAESSSAGRKKRKRQDKSESGVPLQDAAVGAASSSAAPPSNILHAGIDMGVQPAEYQVDRIYAAPIYPEELPFGWQAIWSFEHGKFYFHHLLTGSTTWDAPRAVNLRT